MPLENPIIIGPLVFHERWGRSGDPNYSYCYEALGDAGKWIIVFQDRLKMGKQTIVLTNVLFLDILD